MGFRNKSLSINFSNSIQDKISQIDALAESTKGLDPTEHTPSGKKSKLTVVETYKHLFTCMTVPISQAFIEKLATDLVVWAAEDEDALKLTQFLRKLGLQSVTFYRWCHKYPELMNAKKAALEAIGDRREILALKNKLNSTMVMSQMAKYDDSWRNLESWRAELRAKAQEKENLNTKYAIIVEDFSKKDEKKTDNLPKEHKD